MREEYKVCEMIEKGLAREVGIDGASAIECNAKKCPYGIGVVDINSHGTTRLCKSDAKIYRNIGSLVPNLSENQLSI